MQIFWDISWLMNLVHISTFFTTKWFISEFYIFNINFPTRFAWIVSVNAKVMKKDHCHNIFRIMKFAFTFFANQMPPTLQHTICSSIVSLKNLVILNKKHSNNPFFNLTFCSVYCISSHCICLIFFVTLALPSYKSKTILTDV